MSGNVSLFITLSEADESFFAVSFPHLIKNTGYNFAEIILVADRIKSQAIQQLSEIYLKQGVLTAILAADYSKLSTITSKYCTSFYNFKGNYAYLYGLENCSGDYILHYDADMLLYSAPGFSWLNQAIELLNRYEDLFAVHPSPPLLPELEKNKKAIDSLIKNGCIFDLERGYRLYKHFSTRCFLVRKEIKELTGLYVEETLEEAITDKLRNEKKHRGELVIPDKCFILHSHYKWQTDKTDLQKITWLINQGVFPDPQLDRYDLDITAYRELSKNSIVK